jgi:hypothetical protein
MQKKYLIYLPESQGGFQEEWGQCLKQISNSDIYGYQLIKLNIFVDLPSYEQYITTAKIVGKSLIDAFGDRCPSSTITVHPPEKPWKVSLEASYRSVDSSEIRYKSLNSVLYIVCESVLGKELWAGGIGFGLYPSDTRKAAGVAFSQMKAILDEENMSYDHLVRQWNYIGNILTINNLDQNYQVFNEVRSENYKLYRNVSGYPAATGIGMKYGGVVLDFYAIKAGIPLKILAVENPDQINPYKYGQEVLHGHQPPQFERAVLLTDSSESTLYISGTASIIGQDTIGIDDVGKQTEVTIDNIIKLTESGRLTEISGNNHSNSVTPVLIRVYIKYQADFSKVKSICNSRFQGIPAIYIEADVCRDNLLVEIEAEYSKTM